MVSLPYSPADPPLYLPLTSWRQHQREKTEEILTALEDHDVVLVQAPTGTGKSLIAMALAKATPGKVLLTTQTIQLQQQYLDTFPADVATIWGRANFECPVSPGDTAATAPCTHGVKCKLKWSGCPYYDAKREAAESKVAVLNSAYFLAETNYLGTSSEFGRRDLLIADEGHLLENQLLGFIEVTLWKRTFRELGVDLLTERDGMNQWAVWSDPTGSAGKILNNMLLDLREDVKQYISSGGGVPEYVSKQLARCSAACNALKSLRVLCASGTPVLINDTGNAIKFRPVWVDRLADGYLFQHAEKTVIMSATILDPQLVAEELLGLAPGSWAYVEVPSTFDPKRRPLYYAPLLNVNHRNTEEELGLLVSWIDRIIGEHAGLSGIIHSVSYQLRNEILKRSKFRELMITHDAEDRLVALERFRQGPRGYVLLSPSMGVGVDLPDDLVRWQVIPKVPFPNLGDEQVRIRKNESGGRIYVWQTLCALFQAYGRIMRHKDDWGDTYVLDRNFGVLMRAHSRMFPEWVSQAVVYV